MKLGLNGSTTNQCNLIEDMEVAKASGFDLLELRTYKIENYLNDGGSLTELKQKFEENNIQPYAINALEFFTLKESEEEMKQMLEEAEYWCEVAASINCPYLIAVPSRLTKNLDKSEIINDAVNMLKELEKIARRHHVYIAFEFIGFEDFSVRSLSLANDIIKLVNSEYIGLVVDTYHFYIGHSTLESIQEVEKEKVFVFHVNDAEAGILKNELTEDHRVFPGLGSIPLQEIGKAFQEIGYDKMISLELFRKDYWEMEKYDLGKQAYEHMRSIANKMFP